MKTALHFRKLYSNDVDRLGALLEANNRPEVIDFFHPFPMLRETGQKILSSFKKDSFFVAILNNEFIGFSMLRGLDEGFSVPSFGIFIDFSHQGKGYGRKLTEWTLHWSDTHGIKNIRLTVYVDNKIALKLYQSLGFVKSAKYKDESKRLRFVMYRYLDNV